jgi:integrase
VGPAGFEPATSRLSAGCSSQTKLRARLCSPILLVVRSLYPRLMNAMESVVERKEALLEDPRVKRWFKSRRSASTGHTQLAQLELFLRRTDIDIDRLVEIGRAQLLRKSRKFEDVVLGWIETERKAGRPDAYIAANWAAIRSFLKHEEAAPAWSPKFKIRVAETLITEVVPTPEQLREVLDRTPVPRVRALVLFYATTGLRLGVLGTRFAPANGLRLRHLPDIALAPEPHFLRLPFKVEVPGELSKAGHGFFTFGTEEAGLAICAYLKERIARGEKLSPNSAVLSPEPKTSTVHLRRAKDGTAFVSEGGIADTIRRAFDKVRPKGVRWRPYVLRSFASSQLMLAESAGLMTRDIREYLLGHAVDIGRRYNLGKGRVRSDLEDEVRDTYARAADRFLRILTLSERGVDFRPFYRVLLSGAGYSKPQIDGMGELTEERVIEAIRLKRAEGHEVPEPKPGENARTVSVGELDAWFAKGWRPIGPAGSDRFVIGAPN